MLTPAPTSSVEPGKARGVFARVVPATATRPEMVELTFANTSYRLHLVPTGPMPVEPGRRVVGTIRCRARRVDVTRTGGRYVEPVFGRPRRIQGIVVGGDDGSRTLVVNAGVSVQAELTDQRQKPSGFEAGTLVAFDVHEGATFTPEG